MGPPLSAALPATASLDSHTSFASTTVHRSNSLQLEGGGGGGGGGAGASQHSRSSSLSGLQAKVGVCGWCACVYARAVGQHTRTCCAASSIILVQQRQRRGQTHPPVVPIPLRALARRALGGAVHAPGQPQRQHVAALRLVQRCLRPRCSTRHAPRAPAAAAAARELQGWGRGARTVVRAHACAFMHACVPDEGSRTLTHAQPPPGSPSIPRILPFPATLNPLPSRVACTSSPVRAPWTSPCP